MEYYNPDNRMRHSQEEVVKSFQFLQNFSTEEEYQNNFNILGEYIEDLVSFYGILKKGAEDNADLLHQIVRKVAEFNQPDPKKKYVEKIKNAYIRKKNKEEQE